MRIDIKKTIVFVFMCLIIMLGIAPANAVFAADLSDSIVLHLTESHTDNQIVINANLVTNSGVSAMTLELVYDNSVFEFTNYERGQALNKLDLLSTNLSEDPTLPVKFNWFNQNPDVDNDFSTGNLLKLYFTLKSDCLSGEYNIGFTYNPQGDIVYVGNSNPTAKSAIIDKVVVNVADNIITETEIEDPEKKSETSDGKVNLFLIVGIAVSSVALVALIIFVVVRIRKGKRRQKNWLKL